MDIDLLHQIVYTTLSTININHLRYPMDETWWRKKN